MSQQNTNKVNALQRLLGDSDLVSARWLRAHGYSSSLVARYVRSGWLTSPARGVYTAAARGVVTWEGVLHSLQMREGLALHAGGRWALAWHGHEHYLRLGDGAVVTLYGQGRLPGWVGQLELAERFAHCGPGPFPPTAPRFDAGANEAALLALGLTWQTESVVSPGIVMATPERAVLELCDGAPGATLVYEADAVMAGLAGLRPDIVERLLLACRSVKAKRLFLALAERHAHPWLARVALDRVDLGSGNRALVPGGRMHRKYRITLPADLDEQLG